MPLSMSSMTWPWPFWEAALARIIRAAAPGVIPESPPPAAARYCPLISSSVTKELSPSRKAPLTPAVDRIAVRVEAGAWIANPSKAWR